MLGDSFTEGRGVQYEQTYSYLLESAYKDEVHRILFINAGLGGTGPHKYLQVFTQLGPALEADAVLLSFFANDLADVTAYSEYEPLPEPRKKPDGFSRIVQGVCPHLFTVIRKFKNAESSDLFRKRNLVKEAARQARELGISEEKIKQWASHLSPDLLDAANRFEFNGSLLSRGLLRPEYWITALDVESPADWRRWENTSQILTVMASQCKERNIPLALVYVPDALQYSPAHYGEDNIYKRYGVQVRDKWLSEETKIQRLLKEWAVSEQVPFLDLTPPFREAYLQYGTSLYYKWDTHWTPLGHKIAAEHIRNWLESTGFLQFNPDSGKGIN
jgi:hypothetical protein